VARRGTAGAGRPDGPAAEAAKVEVTRAWIPAARIESVRGAVAALSRRGGRLGTGPIGLRTLARENDEVLVEITGVAPRLRGWEVVGRLEHEEGGPGRLVFASASLERSAWAGAEPWCEHCGLLRRRRVSLLVRHRRGAVRQIGSSCLRDYTGHDLGRALRQVELIERARAAVSKEALGAIDDAARPPLDAFLALVIGVVRERQRGEFVTRSADRDGQASADLALAAWRNGERPERALLQEASSLLAWGRRHLGGRRWPSAYECRLLELLERGGRLGRSEPAIVAGVYLVRERWRRRVFLGAVGATVEAEVKVHAVRGAGRNRFGEVNWHGMRDRSGRLVSWFASGGRRLEEGERYRLRGRVRRHGEWRGRPVTVLSRCVAAPIRPNRGGGGRA
jgi:hypothetical protein